MNFVYCAQCGERFEVFAKAVPSQGKVYNLIRPHICTKLNEEPLTKETIEAIGENAKKSAGANLKDMFDGFKFVQKLNKLDPKIAEPESEQPTHEIGDKRHKDHLRKELTSNAPANLLDNIGNLPTSTPVGNINEEPKGD